MSCRYLGGQNWRYWWGSHLQKTKKKGGWLQSNVPFTVFFAASATVDTTKLLGSSKGRHSKLLSRPPIKSLEAGPPILWVTLMRYPVGVSWIRCLPLDMKRKLLSPCKTLKIFPLASLTAEFMQAQSFKQSCLILHPHLDQPVAPSRLVVVYLSLCNSRCGGQGQVG